MKLTSAQKALLGIATFCRSFYVLALLCCIFGFAWNRSNGDTVNAWPWFWPLFFFQGLMMLLGAKLQPLYVKLVRSNPHISQPQRDYWAKAVLFSSVLSMPAYYLTHVWPGSTPTAPRSRRPAPTACSTHLNSEEYKPR